MSKARDYVFSGYFRGPHLIALALMGVLSLVGCQDSSSSSRDGSDPAGSGGTTSTQKHSGDVTSQTTYYDHSESFVAQALKVKTLGKPVHMFWLVDTTGKYSDRRLGDYKRKIPIYDASGKNMADEIAAINKHLPLLVKSLKEVSAVQVTLMSDVSRYSGTVIDRGVMEINGFHIRDNDLSGGGGGNFLAGLQSYLINSIKYTDTDCTPHSHSVRCHPSEDFFRDPKALKVIVGVRDRGIRADGSSSKNPPYRPESESFLADLKKFSADISSFRYFALIDLRDSYLNMKSCDKTDMWSECNYTYTHLVEQLGGEKYHTNNISASEWTKVFDQLKSKIVEEIGGDGGEKTQKATFTLQRSASKILEVKVEGQALPKTSFQVTGNTLYIDAEHVSEGENIVVKYQSTQSS